MSKEAADSFFRCTVIWEIWEVQPNPIGVTWKPAPPPDWYKQLKEKGCTTEELIRAAAENGYGEFTEQEYNEATKMRADFYYRLFG
jgi:hypothetical protein